MILPDAISEPYRFFVGFKQLGGRIEASPLPYPIDRHLIRKRAELNRLHIGDSRSHLPVPVLKQRWPVIELVARAFHKLWHASGNELRIDGNRIAVKVSVVNSIIETVCWRNNIVAAVKLRQALVRKLGSDPIKRQDHSRPMLRIAKPEAIFFCRLAHLLESAVIGKITLPSFRLWRTFHGVGARKSAANAHVSSRLMLAALRLLYFYRRQQGAHDAFDSDRIFLGLRLRRKGLLFAPYRLWSALEEDNPVIFWSVTIDCPFNLQGLTKVAFQALGKLRDHLDLILIDTGNVLTFRLHSAMNRPPGSNIRYQLHSFG